MKTAKLFFILISSVVLLISCSNNDSNTSDVIDFSGNYKIISMRSSAPVDMNNDGIKSEDVLKEVTTPYIISETKTPGPAYDNSNITATVSYYREKNEGSVFVPYPFQDVIYDKYDSAFLGFYVMQFISFSYKLNVNNEIEVTAISTEHQFAEYGVASSAKRIDKDSFLVVVSAKLFDFKEKKWINADVEIKCQKD